MPPKSLSERDGTDRNSNSPIRLGGTVDRQSSAAQNGRCTRRITMILTVFIGAVLMATLCIGGQEDKHPSLRSFLETSNAAALRALGNDVEASTTDPRRWLNPTGHNLLSEIPGFERQNSSMMWGTYRPGVYFGFKTRTAPVAVTAGLMWHEGDGHAGVKALRHECSEGDKLGPYGWVEHDGISYGKQEIIDQRAGVRLVTSMVKPVQLLDPTTSSSSSSRSISGVVNSDVHIASRVDVFPLLMTGSSPRISTVYLYVGLDWDATESRGEQGEDGLDVMVVDADGTAGHPLVIKGRDAEIGAFHVEASASLIGETTVGAEISIAYVGKQGLPIVDIKHALENMISQHAHSRRRRQEGQTGELTGRPFVLPNEMDEESNVVLLQITGQAPFSVDLVVRASDPLMCDGSTRKAVPSRMVSEWLAIGSRSFSDSFEKVFTLRDKGFTLQDVAAAKAAFSNMIGGMGYFNGRSLVRGAGHNGESGDSFEARLFSTVPSRSFFPRGFLWDEGFHQLLISAWDVSTSIDVLGHWLSVMHEHGSTGVNGGWIPREQILGEEAKRRVPREFVAQDIAVANPPTLLLLVDRLLRELSGKNDGTHVDVEVCLDGRDDHSGSCSVHRGASSLSENARDLIGNFLEKAHPVLDQWVQWLIITQRPGAEGWGGQSKRTPMGAFQWRGRDAGDDRLNPLTLASGLDDYPRASHPSSYDEWHVDVLSWIALACDVMKRLSAVLHVEGVPYGEMYGEIVEGLFDLHWDDNDGAFFDYGRHVSDGGVVTEVVMRCRRADGSTIDVGARVEDVLDGKAVCPHDQQPMYPLGDGKGGLLVRKRWRGGHPRPQHVRHIGYVTIFPLLLKLLPPQSSAVGRLLSHMRDPKELWSPHGLRSLSASDALYQMENNPGDEPYWRGHIWVNVNYLALSALRHYSQLDGPFRDQADRVYSELRTNLLSTLLGSFKSTGYFWEQYDDRSGAGLRSHPFTGWTALVVLIMAEIY